MSRVECWSEFEPLPQEALLLSEILFLEAFFLNVRSAKTRWALGPGSKMNVTGSSGHSRPEIVSLFLRRMAWCCQRGPPIFVDLLRREERLSLEEYINIILTRLFLPLRQNTD
jgi:hypothetical protein